MTMKTLLSACQRFWLIFALLSVGMTVQAQNPTYKLSIANEAQPAPNVYEFDVYLSGTGSIPLELANTQFGIAYDTSILNGGCLSLHPIQEAFSGFRAPRIFRQIISQQPPLPVPTILI